jgi:hypothetical protein
LARADRHAAGAEKDTSRPPRAASRHREAASAGAHNLNKIGVLFKKKYFNIDNLKNQTHYLILTYLLIISMITILD